VQAASSRAPAEHADPLADGAVTDEAAVMFFSAPPVTHSVEPLPPEPVPERATVRRIGDAARRRNLARYVTGAVAVCFLICVAAAVRAGTVRADTNASVPSHLPAPVSALAVPATSEPALPQDAVEPARAPEPASEPPPDRAVTAVDDNGSAPPAEDARMAKGRAQQAINRGDAVGAIEAARQSLDLDESDAETWLILGAAYMQRGAHHDARESFAACARKATHGDRSECRALLR
jgi:hypothetical protein